MLTKPTIFKTYDIVLLGLPGRVSQPHPHPLSQTYRPGMPMVSTYMPSSFYPPYVDWVSKLLSGVG